MRPAGTASLPSAGATPSGTALSSSSRRLLLLAEVLQCPVCFQPFDDRSRRPIDLGCGHHFCERCLLLSPASFRHCPECRVRSAAAGQHVSVTLLRLIRDIAAVAGAASGGESMAGAANEASASMGRDGLLGAVATAADTTTAAAAATQHASSNPASRAAAAERHTAGTTVLSTPRSLSTAAASAAVAGAHAGSSALAPYDGDRLMRRDASAAAAGPRRGAGNIGNSGSSGGVGWSTYGTAVSSYSWLPYAMAVLYVLSPLDVIPDIVPIAGLLDDLLVLAWLTYSALAALQR